jgi:hypothetical protein
VNAILLLVPYVPFVGYMLMLDDIVIIFNHVLHQADDFTLFLQGWLLVLTLFKLSKHPFVLQSPDLILYLLDLLSLFYILAELPWIYVGDDGS